MGDPGFTFFADNFMGGTMLFTFEQRGRYISALCAQKLNGHLTFDQLNTFANNDPMIIKKFKQDENGLYYNVRLQKEVDKRSKFSDSQSDKANKRWGKDNTPASTGAVPGDMPENIPGHMPGQCPPEGNARAIETETDIGFETEKKKGMQGEEKRKPGSNIPPTIEEVAEYCLSRGNGIDAKKFCDHYEARDWKPKGYTSRMKNWQAAVRTWEPDGFKPISKPVQIRGKPTPEELGTPEEREELVNNPFRANNIRNGKGMQPIGKILSDMDGGP